MNIKVAAFTVTKKSYNSHTISWRNKKKMDIMLILANFCMPFCRPLIFFQNQIFWKIISGQTI